MSIYSYIHGLWFCQEKDILAQATASKVFFAVGNNSKNYLPLFELTQIIRREKKSVSGGRFVSVYYETSESL